MRALLAIALAAAACDGMTGQPSGDPSAVDEITCGGGTMLQGNECIAPTLTCGPGTHDDGGGSCIPDDRRFVIRANQQIVADGNTAVDVVVFGRNADGTPATDAIVLNTNRPGSGNFVTPSLTLDARGGKAKFVPCNAMTPGCAGPLQLTVALASAPTQPIATFDVELVAAGAIGSIEHCLTGGNVLYVEGEANFVYKGAITVSNATFNRAGGNQRGFVEVLPTDPLQWTRWTFEISSIGVMTPLAPGLYWNAYQFPSTGHVALNVTNNSPYAYCQQSTQGEFEVHEFQFGTSLERMTVSFRQWCGTPTTKVITGCVHIE